MNVRVRPGAKASSVSTGSSSWTKSAPSAAQLRELGAQQRDDVLGERLLVG